MLALSVSEGLSHAEYTVEDLYSSLIRFGTSLSSTLVLAIVKLEREREREKKTCWNVDWALFNK
jgi:hypothetical protein